MLLATDGMPNCGSPVEDVVTALESLRASGIDTFVLGIPGPVDALNTLANAGGRARSGGTAFYEASTAAELSAAVRAIAGAANSCEYPVPDSVLPVTDLTAFRVLLEGTAVANDASNGWSFTDAAHTRIRLNGAACATLRSGSVTNVVVTYHCP